MTKENGNFCHFITIIHNRDDKEEDVRGALPHVKIPPVSLRIFICAEAVFGTHHPLPCFMKIIR